MEDWMLNFLKKRNLEVTNTLGLSWYFGKYGDFFCTPYCSSSLTVTWLWFALVRS